jgi:microcystin-dependent protein
MPRVEWIDDELSYVESPISADTLYYIYACNDADQWNFNEINPATERPWQETDADTDIPRNYVATKDLRKTIFLSTKVQEHSLMSQTWPGYYARHIGQIVTDERGYFRYSSDLSAIRSLALNPTYLDGLAEISIYNVPGGESFKIITKRGTSGVVMVGSKAVQTYTNDDPRSDEYHTVAVSSIVYDYDQDNLDSPLTDTGDDVNLYVSRLLYVYLTNDRPCWSSIVDPLNPGDPIDMRNKLFVCTEAPNGNGGYLAASWPGNNARWIATIKPAVGTRGSETITNRTFVNTSGWDGHDEWGWSEANENVYHVPPTSVTVNIDLNQTDCSQWTDIVSAVIDQFTSGTETLSKIYHSISFDGKTTWKMFKNSAWTSIARNNLGTWQYWDGDSWENASLNTQSKAIEQATSQTNYQWTKTEIDAMSSANWKATNGWSTNVNTIDWTVVLVNGTNIPYIADGSTNGGTDYVTDTMTSNTAPSPNAVSASSEYISPSCPAWRAFDQNESHTTDPSECWIATAKASEATPQWLKFDFGSGVRRVINKYRLLPRNTTEPTYVASPRNFTLAASNDNTNWTTLDSRVDLGQLASNTWSGYLTFTNNIGYRYYRLSITSSWGDGLTSLSQVKFVEAEYQESSTVPEFTKAAMSVHGALGKSLDQLAQEVTAHTLYELNFSVLNLTTPPEGVLTPKIGNTYGDPVTSGGPQKQYIVSTNTDKLKFVPTDTSDHIIDDVSCKVVTSAAFSGAFIDDSVIGSNVAIDDEVVSSTKTWTSSKIVAATTPLPPGTIIDWAGLVIPTGWLDCNGQGLSTEEYPDLFEAISYTFGGSGSTFNVPNLNSRVTIGYDETRALGATIGAETHTLSGTEMPSHNHSGSGSGSASSSASNSATCGTSNVAAQAMSAHPLPEFTGSFTAHGYGAEAVEHDHGINVETGVSTSVSVSVSVGSAGGSGAHNNMQPSMCLWKLIKY